MSDGPDSGRPAFTLVEVPQAPEAPAQDDMAALFSAPM